MSIDNIVPTSAQRIHVILEEVIIFNPTKKTLLPRAFCVDLRPEVKKLAVITNVDNFKQEDLRLVDNLFKCL